MDRGSTVAFQTEIAKTKNTPVHLCSVTTTGGTVYMTDGYKDISYGGNTYLKAGHFLNFSDIEESYEVMISNVTISLSGVDQSNIANFLNNDYIDQPVKIWLAFLDDSQSLISDPLLIFEGRIDMPVVNEDPAGGTCIVAVQASNAWVDFQRRTGRRANHEEQQIYFPGDMGFEFASEVVHEIFWGRTK